jgi:hypothetical protein
MFVHVVFAVFKEPWNCFGRACLSTDRSADHITVNKVIIAAFALFKGLIDALNTKWMMSSSHQRYIRLPKGRSILRLEGSGTVPCHVVLSSIVLQSKST